MQTLNLTITLPDIVPFDDRAALRMQVLYVKSLVDAGTLDFNDPAQRDAVLEWYLKIVPHIQPTAEESEAAIAEFRRQYSLPEKPDKAVLDDLRRAIRADFERLDQMPPATTQVESRAAA